MSASGSRRVPQWTSILILGGDDGVVANARAVLDETGSGGSVRSVATTREALSALLAPGTPPRLLILRENPRDDGLRALQAATFDPFGSTRLITLRAGPGAKPGRQAIRAALVPRPPSGGLEGDGERLRAGLRGGSVALRYQPIVRIADRRPVGVEALARWISPPREHLTPDAFIPLAESEGLERDLSMAVVEGATREFAGLLRQGGSDLPHRVSINLPLSVLVEADARSWLTGLLRRSGLRSDAVVLELTETMRVHDHALLRRALRRLREAGFTVVLDDLSPEADRDAQLDLPFDGFKLDRALVAAMPHSRLARGRVERLMARAARAGMTVTAEGVSNARLWRAAEAAGVHYAQGFAIGRPVPVDVLPAWAGAWRAAWSRPRSRRGFPA